MDTKEEIQGDSERARRARSWRSLAIIGAGFGGGAAIALTLVVGVSAWYQSRPTPWDERALSVVSSVATETFSFDPKDPKDKGKFAGFALTYALQNNSARDITIAQDVVIMERLAKGKTLMNVGFAKPYSSYFIPARQRAEFSMQLDVGCTEYAQDKISQNRDAKVCFADNFGSADGFVLFLREQRLEVFLPKPALK